MATVNDDANSLYLPLELRPGTNITSKLIMKDETVKNIIIYELLGSNITNNLYRSVSDGTKPDVRYVPTEVGYDQPSILVKIQSSANQVFAIRLIQYCTRLFERYKVVLVVPVFVVENFSHKELEKKSSMPRSTI